MPRHAADMVLAATAAAAPHVMNASLVNRRTHIHLPSPFPTSDPTATHTPKMPSKKQKKTLESINSRLQLVMKSGKAQLGYKQTLKSLRNVILLRF